MSKIFPFIAAVICSAALSSGCSGFLTEETDGKVFDNVLSSQKGLESALTGAYKGLNVPWSIGICNGTFQQFMAGADDIYCPTSDTNGNQFDICGVTDSNGSFASTWNGLYKVIIGANNVIDNYESCSGDAATIKVMAGEAYFLRAYAYFMLVRLWGEIPLILSTSYDPEETSMQSSSEADIYVQIEKDIDNAVLMLEDERRNGEAGRPSRIVARALRAEIYLTEAGWPLKKEGYYAKAAEEAKAVLDESASRGFILEENFTDLFINDDSKDCITSEDLFIIPASTTDNIVFYGAWSEPSEIGGWDIVFAEVGFMNNFPDGIRKDNTFYTEYTDDSGKTVSWENWKMRHPGILKLMKYPQSGVKGSSSSTIPAHLLRLSQTALTYAEAKARADGPDDAAYEWINKIRTRAGLGTLSGLTTEDFITACVNERAWELAGENVRWFDLLRLEMVDDTNASKDPQYDQTVQVKERYTFPLPASETLLNPNLNK